VISPGSYELGATFLSQMNDYDIIPVRDCGIRAIQLVVQRADAYIDSIVVNFSNGSSMELDRNEYYEDSTVSPWIDLPGFSQCVNEVVVVGSTTSSHFGGQAEVQVYGLR
jgi:hypothetical protein